MITLTLSEIAEVLQGKLLNCQNKTMQINAVSTDTRAIADDCLFIALSGSSFDAHDFVAQAQEVGAKALITHQHTTSMLPTILVEDTRIALGQLGAYVKSSLSHLKCAAITGSNGKTTTKELLSAVLQQLADNDNVVLATAGNFNNDIGVPLTLLRLTHSHQFAVLELGANHPGEIAYTSNLVKPNVALINNVMPAHLEGFGSIEGVAKTKGEIWSSLTEQGTGVVNLDADFAADYIHQLSVQKSQCMTFSQRDSNATVFADSIEYDPLGQATFTLNHGQNSVAVTLNLAGQHNVSNALAAACMAIALGVDLHSISQGLACVNQVKGRLNSCQIDEQLLLIDDTYNANSASLKAAIDVLQQCTGHSTLIFADMGELGQYSEQEHRCVGQYAAEKGINNLLTVGRLTPLTQQAFTQNGGQHAVHFNDKNALQNYLDTFLVENQMKSTILVKGSRSTQMEEIVAYIKQHKLNHLDKQKIG